MTLGDYALSGAAYLGVAAASFVAAIKGSKKGAEKGAAAGMNGTAQTVSETKALLVGHIDTTRREFADVRATASLLRDDVQNIKGVLAARAEIFDTLGGKLDGLSEKLAAAVEVQDAEVVRNTAIGKLAQKTERSLLSLLKRKPKAH